MEKLSNSNSSQLRNYNSSVLSSTWGIYNKYVMYFENYIRLFLFFVLGKTDQSTN